MNLLKRIFWKLFFITEKFILQIIKSPPFSWLKPPDTFDIKKNYRHRLMYFPFDDTNNTDQHQNEVYQFAHDQFGQLQGKTLLDFGCGSGFKLIKYFDDAQTTGIEVKKSLNFLKKKYPNKNWLLSDLSTPPQNSYDMILCSDVVEHFKNPNDLMKYFQKIDFKQLVISTPNRDVLASRPGGSPNGPPRNVYHLREWSFDEFNHYVSRFFKIIKHIKDGENQIILAERLN